MNKKKYFDLTFIFGLVLGLGLVLLITLPIALKPECVPVEPDYVEVDLLDNIMQISVKHYKHNITTYLNTSIEYFTLWDSVYTKLENNSMTVFLSFKSSSKLEYVNCSIIADEKLNFCGYFMKHQFNSSLHQSSSGYLILHFDSEWNTRYLASFGILRGFASFIIFQVFIR